MRARDLARITYWNKLCRLMNFYYDIGCFCSQARPAAEAAGYPYEAALRRLIEAAQAAFVDVARPFTGRACEAARYSMNV